LDLVGKLTFGEFFALYKGMEVIYKMENPTGNSEGSGEPKSEPKPLSSANLPKGITRRRPKKEKRSN